MDFYLCRLFEWNMFEKNVEKQQQQDFDDENKNVTGKESKYSKEIHTQQREKKSATTKSNNSRSRSSNSGNGSKNTAIKIIAHRIFFMVEYICKALIWSWLSAKSTELSPQYLAAHVNWKQSLVYEWMYFSTVTHSISLSLSLPH